MKKQEQYIGDLNARKRRHRAIYLGTLVFLALATVFVLAMLIILRSGLFRVREVTVSGADFIPADEVQAFLSSRVTGSSPFKNLLGFHNMLAWPGKFSAADLKLLPEAAAVTVSKDYLKRKIEVRIRPQEEKGIWCFRKSEATSCFWFNEKGLLFRRAPQSVGNLITVLDDYSRSGLPADRTALAPAPFQNLISIFDALAAVRADVAEIRIEDLSLQEASAKLAGGPLLKFSLEFPAKNIPGTLDKLKQETDMAKLEYVDFRVENRVYYK